MPDFFRVERAQLQSWADRVPAASEFPRLGRRLILETGTEVVGLSFSAGEGVAADGWDGSVRSSAPAIHIESSIRFRRDRAGTEIPEILNLVDMR